MTTLYVRARADGQDHFIKFEIEEPDPKRLMADAIGARPSRVQNVHRHPGANPPTWFKNAPATSSRTVKLTVI